MLNTRINRLLFSSGASFFVGTWLLVPIPAQGQSGLPLTGTPQSNLENSIQTNLLNPQPALSKPNGWIWFPEIYLGTTYDDNIYSTRTNKIADTIGTINPSLFAKNIASHYQISLSTGMNIARYLDHATENYTDGWVNVQSQWMPLKTTHFFGGVGLYESHEPRGTPDAFFGTYPTRYRNIDYNLGIAQYLGPWIIRVAGTVSNRNFFNVENDIGWINDLRNHTESSLGARLGYSISSRYGIYIQGIRNIRSYDHPFDNYGYSRDSTGYRIMTGLTFKPTPVLTGEAYIGQMHQQYVDNQFNSINKPDFGANLKWTPSPYTIITGFISRNLLETTLPGTPGDVYTAGGIDLKRWLTRKVRLRTNLIVGQDNYPQIGRSDDILSAGLGLDYRVFKKTFLEFNYTILDRNSNVSNLGDQYYADYTDSQVSLGLRQVFYPIPPIALLNEGSSGRWATGKGLGGLYGGLEYGYSSTGTNTTGGRGSEGVDNAAMGNNGGIGGLFVGYGLTHKQWYYGIELKTTDSDIRWYHNKTKPGGREFSLNQHTSYGGLFRLGHVLPNGVLPYLSLGWIRTRFDTHYDVAGYPATSVKNDLWGTDYGFGIDLPISSHIFARLGYHYIAYPNYDVSYTDGTQQQNEDFHNIQSIFNIGIGMQLRRQTLANYHPKYQGFYAGVQLGNANLSSHLSADQTDSGPVYSQLTSDFANNGFFSGLFLGYGLVTWHRFYIGLEGSLNDAQLGWQHTRSPTGRTFSVSMNTNTTATIKFGYLLRNGALLYVSGGIARARFNTQYRKGNNSNAWIDTDEMETAGVMGMGCRIPVKRNIFITLNYNYENFPNYQITTINQNADTVTFNNKLSIVTIGLGWMI